MNWGKPILRGRIVRGRIATRAGAVGAQVIRSRADPWLLAAVGFVIPFPSIFTPTVDAVGHVVTLRSQVGIVVRRVVLIGQVARLLPMARVTRVPRIMAAASGGLVPTTPALPEPV